MHRLNYLTHKKNTLSSNMNTVNWKIFLNHGVIYRFEIKFNQYSGERHGFKGSIENERRYLCG